MSLVNETGAVLATSAASDGPQSSRAAADAIMPVRMIRHIGNASFIATAPFLLFLVRNQFNWVRFHWALHGAAADRPTCATARDTQTHARRLLPLSLYALPSEKSTNPGSQIHGQTRAR